VERFTALLEAYVEQRFPGPGPAAAAARTDA
jgi:hypothetical protein